MDESEIEYLYGENFCSYFGTDFVKKYFRINLSTEKLQKEILRFICSHSASENENNFLSTKFWQKLVDSLDLKFTCNRYSIKPEFNWKLLVNNFFQLIYQNCSEYNLNYDLLKKNVETPVENLLKKNNFTDVNQLANYICSLNESDKVENEDELIDLNKSIEESDEEIESDLIMNNNKNDDDNDKTNNNNMTVPNIVNQSGINLLKFIIDNNIKQITNDLVNETVRNETARNETARNETARNETARNETARNETTRNETARNETSAKKNLTTTIVPSKYFVTPNISDSSSTKKSLKRTSSFSRIQKNKILKGPNIIMPKFDNHQQQYYDDIPEDNAIDLSRSFQNSTFNKSKNNSYNDAEDMAIIEYIAEKKRFSEIKGAKLWQDMQMDKVCKNRSWQSMKERFRKVIIPKISKYSELFPFDEEIVNFLTLQTTPTGSISGTFSENNSNIQGCYSAEEDQAILDFIFDYTNQVSLMGKTIWVDMSKHFLCILNRERTWASLKERFKKRILPNLNKYELKNIDKSIKIIESCSTSFKNKSDMKRIKELIHKKFKK